ncbi:beta-glucosidase BglX [Bifidobacterium aquikefiri]|uniref:beta-glucosidase BglX n=1 Tax=Bifidobacterium aquikefiri TaxID=1653207 RepID=UPI0023F2BB8D|nr:beta-glucosidase BglX [Bifidobacterium aquikefiri]
MEQSKIEDLLRQMTLEEKIGQLTQITGDFYSDKAEERTGPMSQLGLNEDQIMNIGTVLGVVGAAECKRIQGQYMDRNRLHIPTMFMGDVIHGYETIFPIPLGLASSWDTGAFKEMAQVSAEEASVSGLSAVFSPMVDLVRDPRWGRVMESTGEDPFLNGKLASALVKGYQGEPGDLQDHFNKVAACVKHFAAYGAVTGGRDYNTVDMSEQRLRDVYLRGYRAAIEAGARLVMTSFNTVGGIPATGNRHLMQDILRDEFGFDGVLISDFGAVKELISHGVAADETQAADLSIHAGVDIEMMTLCYMHTLEALVESGAVDERLIDASVLRILQLKNELGLFEHPFRGADEEREKEVVFSEEHRAVARRITAESLVLLRNNDSILPLKESQSVALLGPAAQSPDVLGAWSWRGRTDRAVTLMQGLREHALACDASIASKVRTTEERCDYFIPTESVVAESVELAKRSDVVVLALGELSTMSGEASSRSNIRLPKGQVALFNAVHQVNPHIVVVLFNGRPLDLHDIEAADAILEAWYPGTEGGSAIADVLYGAVNPSGKVTMSFPESAGQIPIYYDEDNTGRPYEQAPNEKYVSKYLDVSNYAAYPFGFGLSYSRFTYGSLETSGNGFSTEHPVTISVNITNDSDVDGVEIAQLYVRDLVGEVVRPVKQLKGFQRVALAAGETTRVDFEIEENDVRYVHLDDSMHSDPGDFLAWVGGNSRDLSEPIRLHLE